MAEEKGRGTNQASWGLSAGAGLALMVMLGGAIYFDRQAKKLKSVPVSAQTSYREVLKQEGSPELQGNIVTDRAIRLRNANTGKVGTFVIPEDLAGFPK